MDALESSQTCVYVLVLLPLLGSSSSSDNALRLNQTLYNIQSHTALQQVNAVVVVLPFSAEGPVGPWVNI